MTTKDDCFSFKDKQNVFVDNNKYKSLNLNQNNHCTFKETFQSKSVKTDDRKIQNNYGRTKNIGCNSFFVVTKKLKFKVNMFKSDFFSNFLMYFNIFR